MLRASAIRSLTFFAGSDGGTISRSGDVDTSTIGVEIAHRVVADLGIDAGIRAVGAAGAEQQRVAVGRRLRHRGCAEHAARAAAILDDDRLSEFLAELRRNDARDHVDAAAGDERHDDLDRLIGIVLRLCLRTDEEVWRQNAKCKKTNPRPAKTHHLHAACVTLALKRIYHASRSWLSS